MRRLVISFILFAPIGTAFAAKTKRAKRAQVQFTDTLTLLSKLAANPSAVNQVNTPPATSLLAGTSNAANDVASLGLGGLGGGESATVGSDAAADEVSDSIKNLFNMPEEAVKAMQVPAVKPSQAPSVKVIASEPAAKISHDVEHLQKETPKKTAKTQQQFDAKPSPTPKSQVEMASKPVDLQTHHVPQEEKKQKPATPAVKKIAPKLLSEPIKVKPAPKASLSLKKFVVQKSAVKQAAKTVVPTAKASVKSTSIATEHTHVAAKATPAPKKVEGISEHTYVAPKAASAPKKIEGMLSTKVSVPKSLKQKDDVKIVKKKESSKVPQANTVKKKIVQVAVTTVNKAKVANAVDLQALAHEKELEAEVASLKAKLAATTAAPKVNVQTTAAPKAKAIAPAKLEVLEEKDAVWRHEQNTQASSVRVSDVQSHGPAHIEHVQTTIAPAVAVTVAPEQKVTVAPKAPESEVAVAPAVSEANDKELTMTMVPTVVPEVTHEAVAEATQGNLVASETQDTQETHMSFFGSIFHWFHTLFFGPDPTPAAPPKLQVQVDPSAERPQFTRQNVETTAQSARYDGLSDLAISDDWSRKEQEDISFIDQVKREDRALRLDAETPKKPSLPASGDADRAGSTHISHFWQTLADEDADIETALTQNGDDLSEYDRLKKLQDAKVVASVSEINGALGEHSTLGRRMRLRNGVAAA